MILRLPLEKLSLLAPLPPEQLLENIRRTVALTQLLAKSKIKNCLAKLS
ncbi:hypothetical protein NSTC745_00336 [Nostoc sp. DSM 114161]|jgi:hypothetical protein